MLKVIALAASVVLLSTATVSAAEEERCEQKITLHNIWCALNYGDALAHCRLVDKYEKRAKHAEVDGDLNGAQYARNQATYQAAECKRLLELHAVEYPKK